MSNSAFREINTNNVVDLIFGPEQSVNIAGDSITIYYQVSDDGAYYKINHAKDSLNHYYPIYNDPTTLSQLQIVLGVIALQSYNLTLLPNPGTTFDVVYYNSGSGHWSTQASKYDVIEIIRVSSAGNNTIVEDVTWSDGGSNVFKAKRVGKYYFDLYYQTNGSLNNVKSDSGTNAAVVAALGATLNTAFNGGSNNFSGEATCYWTGTGFNITNFGGCDQLLGFLIN